MLPLFLLKADFYTIILRSLGKYAKPAKRLGHKLMMLNFQHQSFQMRAAVGSLDLLGTRFALKDSSSANCKLLTEEHQINKTLSQK
jgi:hypothetical protein